MPAAPTGHGVHITGELLGVSEGREWEDRNNVKHIPGIVTLLVGRYTERIEFADLKTALTALGAENEAEAIAMERSTVTLAVRPQGPWDTDDRRFGRVSYRGRTE